LKANHHTHSYFSDGNSHPVDYAKKALELGFNLLGFSEHSPVPFDNTFSFKPHRKEEYIHIINALKSEYAGQLEIALSMEMEFIPGLADKFADVEKEYALDYVIGSVHLVKNRSDNGLWFIDGSRYETYDKGLRDLFGNDIKKAITAYWHQVNLMLETQHIDIIGHLDKIKMHNRGRFFTEDEKWYTDLVTETLNLIKLKEVIIEINTRGIYKGRATTTYPGPDILKQVKELGIRVMINSDAHKPEELDGAFSVAKEILDECGISSVICFQSGEWIEVPA
jgi:histidinol-phosphatase (PHP family)